MSNYTPLTSERRIRIENLIKVVGKSPHLETTQQILGNILKDGYYSKAQEQFLQNLAILQKISNPNQPSKSWDEPIKPEPWDTYNRGYQPTEEYETKFPFRDELGYKPKKDVVTAEEIQRLLKGQSVMNPPEQAKVSMNGTIGKHHDSIIRDLIKVKYGNVNITNTKDGWKFEKKQKDKTQGFFSKPIFGGLFKKIPIKSKIGKYWKSVKEYIIDNLTE